MSTPKEGAAAGAGLAAPRDHDDPPYQRTRSWWRPPPGRRLRLVLGLVLAAVALCALVALSIALGSRHLSSEEVWQALRAGAAGTGVPSRTGAGGGSLSADAAVVAAMRVPRTLLATAVGAVLALGGAVLQGLARNPLADPGVLGINAGASLAIVVAVLVLGPLPTSTAVWFAFAGAGLATAAVYGLAAIGAGGASPVKLALAGAALTALLGSLTSAVLLADPAALEELRMWQVGALAGRYTPVLTQVAPYLLGGTAAALLTGRALNALSLGDDTARSLGVRTGWLRGGLFAVVAVLCGAATAACGPIVFVGLVVPHVARAITGPDYRWVLVYCAVLGPVLVLGADVLGRVLLPSGEVPVGVVLGVLGAPVFLVLVRYRRLVQL